jgi:hypothetical protein
MKPKNAVVSAIYFRNRLMVVPTSISEVASVIGHCLLDNPCLPKEIKAPKPKGFFLQAALYLVVKNSIVIRAGWHPEASGRSGSYQLGHIRKSKLFF